MAMDSYIEEPLDVMFEDGLFDNIEDFLDFTANDEDVSVMVDPAADVAPLPPPTPAPLLPSSVGEGTRIANTSDDNKLCDDINNIADDWFSKFLDDTNFNIDLPLVAATIAATTTTKDEYDSSLFQSFSPVSVLEHNNLISATTVSGGTSPSSSSTTTTTNTTTSSSSFTSDNTAADTALPPHVPARARTKRPRPVAFSPRPHVTLPILPPSSDGPALIPTILTEPESFAESDSPIPKKKKKKTFSNACNSGEESGVRKCMHCEIQKTPQWRAGPMGPKTLCNACGVRYKSGRLFPEYRPAASPTFVPAVHSNSHKKVVEMRIKATVKAPESYDLLEYIRRRE